MKILHLSAFALLILSASCSVPTSRAKTLEAASTTWPTPKSARSVRALQYLLRAHNFGVKVDGKFCSQTRRQVANFQQARHLKVDGSVGAQTWQALIIRVKPGDRGDAVRAVQTLCISEVHSVPVDGIFGSQTAGWIKDFQEAYGLKVDGIVGPQTWRELLQPAIS